MNYKRVRSIIFLCCLLTALGFSQAKSQDSYLVNESVPLVVEDFNASKAASKTPRIIGGEKADDWPWMAALVHAKEQAYQGLFCGGALIDQEWVLTAAHCTEGLSSEEVEVLLDVHNLVEDQGKRFSVDKIIQNRNYDPSTIDSDIALLHLSKSSSQDTVEMIAPGNPDHLIRPFANATILGWGSTDFPELDYPEELRQASIPIVPLWVAMKIYGARNFTINMIAAGFKSGEVDTCFGDSGGPLIVRDESGQEWRLAGITSWGIGCAIPGHPGVYTRVSRFTAWVEFIMENYRLKQNKVKDDVADLRDH